MVKRQTGIEPTPWKVEKLPQKPKKDAVYYVINNNNTFTIYVTDKNGIPVPLNTTGVLPPPSINNIISPDGTIEVNITNGIAGIDIAQNLLDKINTFVPDKFYVHTQNMPSNEWTISHNLDKKPSITVVDTGGTIVEGRITYINLNQVKVKFNGGFSGEAYCN